MLNSKIYAIFALAVVFASAAPAQAGNSFQWPSMNQTAHQYSTSTAPGYEAFGYVRNRGRYRRLPSATINTPAPSPRPVMTAHTGHHIGH
jgi:hypothetical protein